VGTAAAIQESEMSIEAMKQALEALERIAEVHGEWTNGMWAANKALSAIPTLRTAIEAAEKQEPVANLTVEQGRVALAAVILPDGVYDLYTTPPAAQRQWVGLTMEDKMAYTQQDLGGSRLDAMDWADRRLQEKNGGAV
jgi:hypothetical protein